MRVDDHHEFLAPARSRELANLRLQLRLSLLLMAACLCMFGSLAWLLRADFAVHWSEIQTGDGQEKVRALLGEPDERIDRPELVFPWWPRWTEDADVPVAEEEAAEPFHPLGGETWIYNRQSFGERSRYSVDFYFHRVTTRAIEPAPAPAAAPSPPIMRN